MAIINDIRHLINSRFRQIFLEVVLVRWENKGPRVFIGQWTASLSGKCPTYFCWMEIQVYSKLSLAGSRLSLMGCLGDCWVWQRQMSQCFLVVSLPSSPPSRDSFLGLWLLFSVTRKPLFKLFKSVHSGMESLTTVGAALFDCPPCSFLSLSSPSVDLGRTQWERFRELFFVVSQTTPRLSLLYLFRQEHI